MIERKPLFWLSRSQAEDVLVVRAKYRKVERGVRTVCFGDHLPDSVAPLVAGPDVQLDFDEKDREGAADRELVLDSATCCHAPRHDRFRGVADEQRKFGLDPAQELSPSGSVNVRRKSGKSRTHRRKETRPGFLIAMLCRWAVLVEPWSRDTRAPNQESVTVMQIADRIQPGQRRNFLEGYFAERHLESFV